MATRRASLGEWLGSLFPGLKQTEPGDFASALVEHLADGVVACDADGNIVILNRRAREGSDGFPAHVAVPSRLTQDQWAEYFQLYPPGGSELLPTIDPLLLRDVLAE